MKWFSARPAHSTSDWELDLPARDPENFRFNESSSAAGWIESLVVFGVAAVFVSILGLALWKKMDVAIGLGTIGLGAAAVVGAFFQYRHHLRQTDRRFQEEATWSSVHITTRTINLIEHGEWSVFARNKHNVLDISRLRLLQLPANCIKAWEYDEEAPKFPRCWYALNRSAKSPQYALIAEGVEGQPIFPIAIGYPKEILSQFALRLRNKLNEIRAEYHQQLAKHNPGIRIPQNANYVPVCDGLRKAALLRKAKRPAETKIEVQQSENGLSRFVIPAGDAFEFVTITASKQQIRIRRDRPLGVLKEIIDSDRLLGIEVMDSDLEDNDESSSDARLAFHFLDRHGQTNTVECCEQLSFAELAWLAASIRSAGPTIQERVFQKRPKEKLQFTMGHLAFAMLLVAGVGAAWLFEPSWGWLYSITVLATAFCLISLTGATWLLPWKSRSWTKTQLVVVSSILALLWIGRTVIWICTS
ncbi:MAG: hypothetical protein ACE361_16475 [Aureliella sp.]